MTILSLDQSTRATGWAFYDGKHLAHYGVITADVKETNPITRILYMHDQVAILLDKYKPDYCVIEDTQYQNSQSTFQLLSQLAGSIYTLFHQRNLPFNIVPPVTWKSAMGVKGKKRAEQKASTIILVKEKYNIDVGEDEADAIGILAWAVENIANKQ